MLSRARPDRLGRGRRASTPAPTYSWYVAVALFSGISVLGWLASVVELRWFGCLSERLLQRLREAALHALARSLARVLRGDAVGHARSPGSTADVEAVALSSSATGSSRSWHDVVVLVAALLSMVVLSPALFVIVFVVVGPVSVGLFTHFLRRSRRADDEDPRAHQRGHGRGSAEGVAGIAVVQAFGAEQRQRHVFETANTGAA